MTTEQAKKKIEILQPKVDKLWASMCIEEEVFKQKQQSWYEVHAQLDELKNFVKFSEASQ